MFTIDDAPGENMAEETKDTRQRTVAVHITQDDYGFWMMSF
jgi:hypothetical protein